MATEREPPPFLKAADNKALSVLSSTYCSTKQLLIFQDLYTMDNHICCPLLQQSLCLEFWEDAIAQSNGSIQTGCQDLQQHGEKVSSTHNREACSTMMDPAHGT